MFGELLTGIKSLAFPDNCHTCGTFLNSGHTRQLCPSCFSGIALNTPPFCAMCSRHLGTASAGFCPACIAQQTHYNKAWAVCQYNDAMRHLIHSFKYSGHTALRRTFVNLITGWIDQYNIPIKQFDCVVPIPLHPVKLRERGFNQSEILSADLCRHYNLIHKPSLLARQRPTETQALLDQKQRWTNLTGAFRINPSDSVEEELVLLVDDLLTTGATVDAAASALKNAGAAYVGVLTLAVTEL